MSAALRYDPPAPDPATGLLLCLSRLNAVAVPLDRLAVAWGLAEAEALEVAAGLVELGLLEAWDAAGPVVSLSALAAERLGLELGELHPRRDVLAPLRWVPAGEGNDPGPARPKWMELEADHTNPDIEAGSWLDTLADPDADDPADLAERVEEAAGKPARLAAVRKQTVPLPFVILGIRPPGFPRKVKGEPCPGCGDKPLPFNTACVIDGCGRSGVDAMLEKVLPRDRPRKAYVPDPDGRAGGRGEAVAGHVPEPRPRPKRHGKRSGRTPGGYVPPARNSFDLKRLAGGMG